MIIFLLIVIFLSVLLVCFNLHIHVDLRSFLRKGFHKKEDDYGLYCMVAHQRSVVKLMQLLIF